MALNDARIPTVTVECGTMRNGLEAKRMQSPSGQGFDAQALVRGIRTHLAR